MAQQRFLKKTQTCSLSRCTVQRTFPSASFRFKSEIEVAGGGGGGGGVNGGASYPSLRSVRRAVTPICHSTLHPFHPATLFTCSMSPCGKDHLGKDHSDLDVALPAGVGDEGYMAALAQHLPPLLDGHRPDLVGKQGKGRER
jgi:hypothetical protein